MVSAKRGNPPLCLTGSSLDTNSRSDTMLREIETGRTGPELSCSRPTGSICSIFVLVCEKKPSIETKKVITRFRSKNRADPVNSLLTLGAERSKNLSDTERITFGIEAFQVIIVTKIVSDKLDQV